MSDVNRKTEYQKDDNGSYHEILEEGETVPVTTDTPSASDKRDHHGNLIEVDLDDLTDTWDYQQNGIVV